MKKMIQLGCFSLLLSCGGSQTLNVLVNVTGQGVVESNPIQTDDVTYIINVGIDEDSGDPLADGTAKVEKDGTVTLTATPNEGSVFIGWTSTDEDFACTTGVTCSFIVKEDTTISAAFATP